MGNAEEERLVIAIQKYSCLYDKTILAFQNKNEKKNAWKAVGKNLSFETGEAAKNSFTSLQTTYMRRKKTLKDSKKA